MSQSLRIADSDFQKHYARIPERLWKNAFVLRDEDAAHGYVVPELEAGPITPEAGYRTCHYTYVPPDLRRLGLAKAMIEATCGKLVTITSPWPYNMPSTWRYNPYAAMA